MNINGYVPQKKLTSNHLISLYSVASDDIYEILHLARDIKRKKSVGEKMDFLNGKRIVLLTKKNYLRTQIAFQIASEEMGGHPIVASLSGSSIEEELKDPDTTTVVKNFGVSGFIVDTSYLSDAEILKRYSDLPVVNANEKSSPVQTLAALLTIWEKKGTLQGLKLAVIGNTIESDFSILIGAAKCGMDISVVCPSEYEPPIRILNYCSQFGSFDIYDNIEDGVRGANVIYIMNNEMGKEYLFSDRYFRYAAKDPILLHGLPLNRNVDISEETVNCPNSVIFEQAENSLPVLEAVLSLLIGNING